MFQEFGGKKHLLISRVIIMVSWRILEKTSEKC